MHLRALAGVAWAVAAGLPLVGCASGSQASAGAASGAKSGAIGGVVAGAVGALLWGGNPLEGAVKTGIAGAAAGAAVGGVAGAEADAAAKRAAEQPAQPPAPPEGGGQPSSAELAALRERMGERTWDAAVLLAHCRHDGAIAAAENAFATESDPGRRVYALLVEAVAAEESGARETAAALYPRIVAADPARGSEAEVRVQVLEGVLKLQRLRLEHGLPALCPAPPGVP
jgi:hypothetical protein